MNIKMQKATQADAPALLTIMNDALQFKLAQGDTAWEEAPFTKAEILEAIARDTTYIARVNGTVAGSVVLTWRDERMWGEKGLDNQAGYIHSLAIRDAFRGQQVGQRIVAWCYKQMRDSHRLYARLDCPTENPKLCACYEKQGFKQVGTKSGNTLYERAT